MGYLTYQNLTQLEPFSMIASSTFEITYQITANPGDGEPIELSGKEFEWRMAPYGEKNYAVVTKLDAEITSPDIYTRLVLLEPSDTEGLSGKFIHQIIITDADGTIYRPAQGLITIVSNI